MKILTIRNFAAVVAVGTVLACSPFDCDKNNSSSSEPPFDSAPIQGFWPCIGPAGTSVTLYGPDMSAASVIDMVGAFGTPTTSRTTKSMTFDLPAGAQTSVVSVRDTYGRTVGTSPELFTVGTDDPVPEIESNDDTNGADATPMGPRTRGTGTLSGTADRDHFRRSCFMVGARYSVTVTPRVTGIVYVNGAPVALDAGGRGEFNATQMSNLFGMTDGDGAYTMTIGFVSPPP